MRKVSLQNVTLALLAMAALGSVLTSCRIRDSQLHIGNGVDAPEDSEFNRPVQMLYDKELDRGICTLTFVNDTTALTAAHCVHKKGGLREHSAVKKPNGAYVETVSTYVNGRAIKLLDEVDQKYEEMDKIYKAMYASDPSCRTTTEQNSRDLQRLNSEYGAAFDQMTIYDFAILVFPAGTGESFVKGGKYYGISPRKVEGGSIKAIKMMGFGNNKRGELIPQAKLQSCDERYDSTGFGIRRQGTNSTVVFQNGVLNSVASAIENVDPDGKQVYTMGGDSGSMWIACEETTCDTFEGIAVTTGGGFNGVNETSVGPRLYSDESLGLIYWSIHCSGDDKTKCAAPFKGSEMAEPSTTPDDSIKVAANIKGGKASISFSIDKSSLGDSLYVCTGNDIAACGSYPEQKVTAQPRTSGNRLVYDNVSTEDLSKKIMILRVSSKLDPKSKAYRFMRYFELAPVQP